MMKRKTQIAFLFGLLVGVIIIGIPTLFCLSDNAAIRAFDLFIGSGCSAVLGYVAGLWTMDNHGYSKDERE